MAAEAPAADLGRAAPPFALRGTDGHTHTLADLAGPRGTVVAFICNHCPYVKAILPRLVRDARDLKAIGVHVIGINANDATAYPEDSYERMVELALPFPYLHDETQQVARAYGAVCTPDFFGFDAQLQLRYRGRLDASRKDTAPEGTPRELFDAMKAVAETGRGPAEQHHCIGCSIKWRD
ncbi:MAG: thioredoxin family protein [Gammaproteobacteria bacterium]|uniref:thioredoxin family protein n=1 Tax=Azohydromonas sp. TaxID=1872666 RepID=UPI002C7F652E|nr:thioredoxin family protein [Azohydromonas sp.]HMM84025.1 thioredoxin family protein [Azohydromonas sp.]